MFFIASINGESFVEGWDDNLCTNKRVVNTRRIVSAEYTTSSLSLLF